jgi:hypothetical protein
MPTFKEAIMILINLKQTMFPQEKAVMTTNRNNDVYVTLPTNESVFKELGLEIVKQVNCACSKVRAPSGWKLQNDQDDIRFQYLLNNKGTKMASIFLNNTCHDYCLMSYFFTTIGLLTAIVIYYLITTLTNWDKNTVLMWVSINYILFTFQ